MNDAQVNINESAIPADPTGLQVSSDAVARRARFVFALSVGFYLYGLLIAGLFVFGGWFMLALPSLLAESNRSLPVSCGPVAIALLCFGTALFILFNLLPRPERFRKPG